MCPLWYTKYKHSSISDVSDIINEDMATVNRIRKFIEAEKNGNNSPRLLSMFTKIQADIRKCESSIRKYARTDRNLLNTEHYA